MPNTKYARVIVTTQDRKIVCDPDWVHLHAKKGPSDIQWVFQTVPKEAVGAVVEFVTELAPKHQKPSDALQPFRPRGVHRGLGHAASSGGSRLADIVTSGNTGEQGHFYYNVKLLDKTGKVIAQADPGGDNDPDTGGG
jgi:hypothetical protein